MHSLTLLPILLGTALALPNPFPNPSPSTDPVRILPYLWRFNITALSGPGCPDFGQNPDKGFVTRPTYGQNTVDGSEIYYWHFAYPHLRASVDAEHPEASTWCETTLRYEELDKDGKEPAVPGYRLRLHKNGTAVIASYEIEEGVEVAWRAVYYSGKDKIVDTLKITGPRTGSERDISPVGEPVVQWPLPECGTGTIKYRTELTVKATKKGAKGTVASETVQSEGKTEYYGVQQGISYDWEKCAA